MAAAGYRAARLLARAYYRLGRAVWSGFTIPGRGQGAGELVTLLELYQDFETLAFADPHLEARRHSSPHGPGGPQRRLGPGGRGPRTRGRQPPRGPLPSGQGAAGAGRR